MGFWMRGQYLAVIGSSATFDGMDKRRIRPNSPLVPALALAGSVVFLASFLSQVGHGHAQMGKQEQLIPILGVTVEQEPKGTVVYLILSFEERVDRSGLAVHFKSGPGRFSRMAQTSVQQAIRRAAHNMGLSADSWTVVLSVPYNGLTVYGESLSAMVSLSVMAMANGDYVATDRVVTGTVTPDGHIGPVGSVPMKVVAAERAHIRRVIVPDEQDPADGDWQTPFLMQVSPVDSVEKAYLALTESASVR